MADSKVYTPIGGRSGSGGRGGRGGRGQNPVALNLELRERERERGLQRRWEEKGEKGIGSAVDAGTATMPSGPSATDVSSPAFSSTPKPPPILNGSPVSATGSALQERDRLLAEIENLAAVSDGQRQKMHKAYAQKLKSLETQKKQDCQLQLLKQKQRSDEAAKRLLDEIKTIKVQKHKIKQEAEQFRQWKASHEKELLKLRKEGRRNQYEQHKLQALNQHQKMDFELCLLVLLLSKTCIVMSVLGIILGGGVGTRLYPLTKKRKPAVPLGANYHLIDILVSNCLNSNISKIYVLTQFNSASLNRHLSQAYASNIGGYKNEGFVEVLAAQQSPENPNWFQLPSMLLVQGALPNLSAPTALLQTTDTHSSHLMQPQASSYGSIPPSQIPSSGMSPSPGAFMGQQFPNNMPFPRPQKVDTVSREVPYITTALMYAKLGTEGRKDLFDWLSRWM
ncbi:unnamed protein product [Camellia sinensis]